MRYLIPSLSLVLLSSAVHADRLKPTPEPGLWQANTTSVVNGQDMLKALQQLQEELVASQPEELRAMMREAMDDEEPHDSTFCVSREEVVAFTQPENWLRDLQEGLLEHCEAPTGQLEGSTYSFKAKCNAPKGGFIGEVTGEMRIINSKKILTDIRSVGVSRVDLAGFGGAGVHEELVEARQTEEFLWLGSDCGPATD